MKTAFLCALTFVLASTSEGANEVASEIPSAAEIKLKNSKAIQVLEDLRQIDAAIDQFAIENNKKDGAPVLWTDVLTYLKPGTRLYGSRGMDSLGNAYVIKTVGVAPKISQKTAAELNMKADFWGPFAPEKRAVADQKDAPGAPVAKQGEKAAREIHNELRMIDSAIDQFAIENNKKEGDPVVWANLLPYIYPASRLHGSEGKDPAGNPYMIKGVGVVPKLSAKTAEMFDVPKKFWEPYLPE